jgi:hypothetical protein
MYNLILCASLLFMAHCSNAQKPFTFSVESGAVQPIPIFYKGIDASSNEDRKITANIGLSAIINCTWNYDRNSYISLGAYFDSYSLDIKEFGTFPEDITPGGAILNRSFLYSNFDVNNLGFRVSFGNTLGQKVKLNAGFQLGFPLNHHFGYIYLGARDSIVKMYDYETRNPFSLFVNVEYQWYKTKRMEFTLVPEFAYTLQKDAKTYVYENQIRKIYFALRLGIGLKK